MRCRAPVLADAVSWRQFCLVAAVMGSGIAVASAGDGAAAVYGLKVTGGARHFQVFQRSRADHATFTVRGQAFPHEGHAVQWRIRRNVKTVIGFDWRRAKMTDGTWRADVEKLPTGGPYRVQFRLVDHAQNVVSRIELHNILVGDLWFLGGQSNMDGCGRLEGREASSMMVNAYTLADEWMIAEDPLHIVSEGAYRIYRTSYGGSTKRNPVAYRSRDEHDSEYGTGLGVTFGQEIHRHTQVPIGLIVGSLGGSAMLHWDPAAKEEAEDSLYWCMMKRIADLGGEIRGILWWQGESDVYAPQAYEQKLRRFIRAVRHDLGQEDLPFFAVQLSHGSPGVPDESMKPWAVIQDAQRRVMADLRHGGIVSTIDLPLQDAHLTSDGYRRVGRRLAKRVLRDVYGQARFQPGPHLEKIEFFESMHGDGLRLVFSGVNGRLRAPGRVSGFSLRRSDQTNEGLPIVRQEIDPDDPHAILLHLLFRLDDQDALNLWYGWGADAGCNVVDEQDMALPMFGPMALDRRRSPDAD